MQEVLLVAFALASFWYTPADLRERNRFTLGPMIEVAILFAGIFVTMTPALLILNARGGRLGLHEPWQFFWASGLLSGFLDNAPTYLAFTAVASGTQESPLTGLVPGSWTRAQSRLGLRAGSGRRLVWLRLDGGADLHWEWAELHDSGHRPRVQYPHAKLSRLHRVFGVGTPSTLCACDDSLLSRVNCRMCHAFGVYRSCLE